MSELSEIGPSNCREQKRHSESSSSANSLSWEADKFC
jgi:hypothetical protein